MPCKRRDNCEIDKAHATKRVVNRVGAYVRLSAEDKKHKGDSIETQQAIISAFIAERIDLELIETYIDDGRTGQNTNRPGFSRMYDDMLSGKIDCCITKDLSRLGRNAIDACMYIEHYFPENNVRYIAINDSYDSNNKNSGGFEINIMNIVNEAYALEVGRKVSETKQMNIRDGCFVGRIPPYGYLKSSDNKYKLIKDDYAAPIVRHIFNMAADGCSVSEIQKWLADKNVLPPKRYFHSIGLVNDNEAIGHIHWNRGVLYSMLHNRVYCGDMVQGKGRTHRYIRRRVPQSEWIVVEDKHEPIVSREIFEEVQKRWEIASGNLKNSSVKKSGNIFLRKIFCGHCGYTMRRDKSGKTQFIFLCGTRQNYGADDCTIVSINEFELKQKLLADIKKEAKIIGNKKSELLLIKEDNVDNEKLHEVLNELEKNEKYFKSLYESYTAGILRDITDYENHKDIYTERIENLKEQKRNLMLNIHNRKVQSAARSKAITGYKSVKSVTNITTEVIEDLIDKIIVYEDKSIKVHYKYKDKA